MLIDLSKHFVEIRPDIAPTTLVIRALDTGTFLGELKSTSTDLSERDLLAPDARLPMSPLPFRRNGRKYLPDGPAHRVEWKITKPGNYWIGSAYLELPQPDTDRELTRYRSCQVLLAPEARYLDLVTELQRDIGEWGHIRVYLTDYNPLSAEPTPLSGEVSVEGRPIWERLDEGL